MNVATSGLWQAWQHPRGQGGRFIKVNDPVDVKRSNGRTERGQVVKLTRKGPRVRFADGSEETVPSADTDRRIKVAPRSFARLGDDTGRRIGNAPGAQDSWAGRAPTAVNNAPGGRRPAGAPAAPPPAPNAPPAPSGPNPNNPRPGGTTPRGTQAARIRTQYGISQGPVLTGGRGGFTVLADDGSTAGEVEYRNLGGTRWEYTVTAADGTTVGQYSSKVKAMEAMGKHRQGGSS